MTPDLRWDLLPSPLAVVDLETSGGHATRDRIVEIGILRLARDEAPRWLDTLVDPGGSVGPTWVHGITAAEVRGAPRFEELAPLVGHLLDGAVMIAHNASFEYRFLRDALAAAGVAWSGARLCSLRLSQRLFPTRTAKGSHGLEGLMSWYALHNAAPHRAFADVLATTDALAAMLQDPDARDPVAAIRLSSKDLPTRAPDARLPGLPRLKTRRPYLLDPPSRPFAPEEASAAPRAARPNPGETPRSAAPRGMPVGAGAPDAGRWVGESSGDPPVLGGATRDPLGGPARGAPDRAGPGGDGRNGPSDADPREAARFDRPNADSAAQGSTSTAGRQHTRLGRATLAPAAHRADPLAHRAGTEAPATDGPGAEAPATDRTDAGATGEDPPRNRQDDGPFATGSAPPRAFRAGRWALLLPALSRHERDTLRPTLGDLRSLSDARLRELTEYVGLDAPSGAAPALAGWLAGEPLPPG